MAAAAAPSRAPATTASAPAVGAPAADGALGRSFRSSRRRATSVDGSRPTTRAGVDAPSCATIECSSSSGSAFSAATMRPGRQEKPLSRERADWMETRLGATSRTRAASPVDKAMRTEEAGWSAMGNLLFRLRCPSTEPTPPRQMVRTGFAPRPSRGFALRGTAAYISGPQERSEVQVDKAGARFRPDVHMGSRVRRDSAQSSAAESNPGAPLLRAGGEEGHSRGRQRLRLAGRDGAAQCAVRRSDLPSAFRRRRRSPECQKRSDRASSWTHRVLSSPTTTSSKA